MSTAGRPSESAPAPDAVAAACRDAGLVRLVGTADGDALAATGLVARALAEIGVPFQASLTPSPTSGSNRVAGADAVGTGDAVGTDADATLTLGMAGGDLALTESPTSAVAHEVAAELGAEPEPALALAGVTAAGRDPAKFPDILTRTDDAGDAEVAEVAEVAEDAEDAEVDEDAGNIGAADDAVASSSGVERRAGVAVPTADLADGLAHTTLAHAPFSGDVDATREALSGLEDDTGRRVASLLGMATAAEAPPRAAKAVERAIRPYVPGGPFATVGGYADVLDAVARERPGTGLALVLGFGDRADGGPDDTHGASEDTDDRPGGTRLDVREESLATWRDHARRAHECLRQVETARYSGLVAARIEDGPLGTVARLLRDFRSPEPVVLVTSGTRAAAAAVDRAVEPLLSAGAAALDGDTTGHPAGDTDAHTDVDTNGEALAVVGRGETGYAVGVDDHRAFLAAFREAV